VLKKHNTMLLATTELLIKAAKHRKQDNRKHNNDNCSAVAEKVANVRKVASTIETALAIKLLAGAPGYTVHSGNYYMSI
jgi:hypothetical protein